MIYIIEIIYGGICIILAWNNSVRISKGQKIFHALNGATHITTAVLVSIFFGWWTGLIILCTARIVFNTALNYFRKLPFDYVSSKPVSFVDRLEKKYWGNNGFIPLLIYGFILIGLNILYGVLD